MDETRDIAIESREQGRSAHKRLDGINGQIARLGESHERIRTDLTAQVGTVRLDLVDMREDLQKALYDPEQGMAVKLVELTATVHLALKVAGALVSIVAMIAAGVGVYAITHEHTSQPQAATTK